MARPADPNTKIDLLRAAEAVFAERGLDHAKVEEITERAGHSKGSFYLHFESKEDAFRQIVESTLARLATCLDAGEIDESVRLPPAEHVERWRAHDLEMFEFIWANRRVMRLMLEGGGSAQFGYLIDQFADRSRKEAAVALALGRANGLYRARSRRRRRLDGPGRRLRSLRARAGARRAQTGSDRSSWRRCSACASPASPRRVSPRSLTARSRTLFNATVRRRRASNPASQGAVPDESRAEQRADGASSRIMEAASPRLRDAARAERSRSSSSVSWRWAAGSPSGCKRR